MGNELDLVAAMTNAHLSDFDGKQVVRAGVALFGTDGLSEAMAVNPMEIPQGTEGVLVVRWVCEEVKHKKVSKDTPELLTRNHRLRVMTVAFVENKAITKLLDEQEETVRKAKEKARGVSPLTAPDGTETVNEAEKAAKARKRGDDPAVDAGVVQSGEFKSEPFDSAAEKARRTPAAKKAPVAEAVEAAEKIAAAKAADNVTNIGDARRASSNDG